MVRLPGSAPDRPQVPKEHHLVYVNNSQEAKTSIPGSLGCFGSAPFLCPSFFEGIIVSGCITVIELGCIRTSATTCRPRSNGQGARIVSSTGTYPARDPFRLRLRSLQILRAHLLMGNIFISSLLHSHSSPRIVSSVLGRWLIYSNAIRPGRGKVGEVGSHSAFPYGKFSITRE